MQRLQLAAPKLDKSQASGGGPKITLLDARPDAEFTGADGGMNGAHVVGHLPDARQLVWNTLLDSSGRFLPDAQLQKKFEAIGAAKGTPVVSYCMVGMRASVTYFAARHLGYDSRAYDGSIVDWTRRKLPAKTGALMAGKLDFLQGTLDLPILKTLQLGAQHGWGISQRISRFQTSPVRQPGLALSGAAAAESAGWIDSEWGASDNNRQAKFYKLTRKGERQLKDETLQWARMTGACRSKILDSEA